MKYIYYTRHGESLINTNDLWADAPGSAIDLGLTERGRDQVRQGAAEARNSGIKPDYIICSPLMRTRETARIFAETLGHPLDAIEYNELFLEIQVGSLEGTSYSAFCQRYTYADLAEFDGAETIEMLQQRAAKALAYIKSRPEETILVVSHSCFGRAFKRVIKGLPYTDEFLNAAKLPYGKADLVYEIIS